MLRVNGIDCQISAEKSFFFEKYIYESGTKRRKLDKK